MTGEPAGGLLRFSLGMWQFFANFAIAMKTSSIIGTVILALVWGWLAWGLLSAGGVNLKNILILAMTGIIIFVPLYKKYFRSPTGGRNKSDIGNDARH